MSTFKRDLYHGRYTVYKDGTGVLLENNDECRNSTNYPFWKLPKHTDSEIETRAMVKQKEKANFVYVLNYQDKKLIQ